MFFFSFWEEFVLRYILKKSQRNYFDFVDGNELLAAIHFFKLVEIEVDSNVLYDIKIDRGSVFSLLIQFL